MVEGGQCLSVLRGGAKKRLRLLDLQGTDIGPWVEQYAGRFGVPVVLLVAMIKAESGMDETVLRELAYPDISAGLTQITIRTAAGYDLGDGTLATWPAVKAILLQPEPSIRYGAEHLGRCYARAKADWLQALICYNSGSCQPPGNWYWQKYGDNIQRYRDAMRWARGMIGLSDASILV